VTSSRHTIALCSHDTRWPRLRRARAPSPAKRHPVNCTRVDAGEVRGEGPRDTPPWGRTSRFVRVHPPPPTTPPKTNTPNSEATSCRAGARVCAPGAASDRMGKRQKAPYSRLGPPRPHSSPLLSSPLSLLSSLGRRPGVSWLVETPKRKPTLPQHTQLPPRTFPEGELFHSPGLPRQRLPGVPALKKFRKPVGLRLNAARHTPFAGSTRCATGERHSTRWPETDRTSRRGSAQEGQSPTKSPHTFPRHPHLSPSPLAPRLMSVTPIGVGVLSEPRPHQTTSRPPGPPCPPAGFPPTTNRSEATNSPSIRNCPGGA
jgi:hypothetical protein